MTTNLNLDRNRIDAMIAAALSQDEVLLPELRRMADRMEEPADALAGFLVGDLKRHQSFEDMGNLPCSSEQWKYFMERCREATKGNVLNAPLWKNPEVLARYARIGGWPDRIPYSRRDCPSEFMDMSYQAAWSWAWTQDENTPRFIRQGFTNVVRPGAIDHGFIFGLSLVDAIGTGLVEVPAESVVRFVVTYGKWYEGAEACNADVASLCHALKARDRLESMPEDDLQALAGVWGAAATELARRRIPLAVALLQEQREWIFAYLHTIEVLETAAEAVEEFAAATDPVVRYRIHQRFQYGPLVKDPADPFGPPVNEFARLLQAKGVQLGNVPMPTYDECLAHMRQHS